MKQADLSKAATLAETVTRALDCWAALEKNTSTVGVTVTPATGPAIHLTASAGLREGLRLDIARLYAEAAHALREIGGEPTEPPASMLAFFDEQSS